MKIAILTGASAGLGKEYFRALNETRTDLDEIWMIARRTESMQIIADEYPEKRVRLLSLDLTEKESFRTLERILAEEKPSVRLLISNAGCGRLGNVIDENWEDQIRQTELNVTALTAVTNLCLKYMPTKAEKGEIKPAIIQVCSIASFCPNPRMTVYSSTKAYVLSYAKSLGFELKGTDIHVLCVCPGPMDTEFLGVAGIRKGSSPTFDTLPRTNPQMVARRSLAIAQKRGGIWTPRAFFKFYRVLAKLIPHGLMLYAAKT